MYFNLLFLAAIVVFVVDISGVVDALKSAFSRWLGVKVARLKPLDCSCCMVWWCGLCYLLIVGRFALGPIAFIALLAACSVQLGGLIQVVGTLLQWGIDAVLNLTEQKTPRA